MSGVSWICGIIIWLILGFCVASLFGRVVEFGRGKRS